VGWFRTRHSKAIVGRNDVDKNKKSDHVQSKKKKKKISAGLQAELMVVQIVEGWLESDKKPAKELLGGITIDYILHAHQNDRVDVEGMDIQLFLNTGLIFPLQVKKHHSKGSRRHKRLYPHVKFLFNVGDLSPMEDDNNKTFVVDDNYKRIESSLEKYINNGLAATLNCDSTKQP